HLGDQELLRSLAAVVANERASSLPVLEHIAEVDARRLYAPAGYDSMYSYCVHVLHMSDDSTLKRIRAARAASKFPGIFAMVADGRLHLSGLALLAKHLTPENADELLATAAHKTRIQIKLLIAHRFPQADVPTRVEALPSRQTQVAARPVDAAGNPSSCAASRVAPGPVDSPEPHPKVAPLSPGRFSVQAMIAAGTYDKLEYAKALLGHTCSGEFPEVLDRALDALIAQLEKQKFAATTRPRPERSSADPRHIPAAVKRAVWERDGGQCTFVSEGGHRCGSRKRLEFDHLDPVARGGEATVEGIRLRCRAHNQYEAECAFGAGFMEQKRDMARQAREEAKARAAVENDPDRSVIPWLRRLGFKLQDAREGAAYCERMAGATMEEKIRAALRYLPSRNGSPGRAA
ncbi:MAG TPA: hypothetical protein VGK89_05965, partial [Candidatus Eisenbacteria bacterium]